MDKKSIVIGALGSALLFVTVGAANPTTVVTTSPVEHVWHLEIAQSGQTTKPHAFAINKKTGEVRKYSPWMPAEKAIGPDGYYKCVKRN